MFKLTNSYSSKLIKIRRAIIVFMKHYIVTQARNESVRLQNWIAYYKSQGLDGVLFFDDSSTDNTVELLNTYAFNYNFDIRVCPTDKIGEVYNTGNSNTYGGRSSVTDRIIRSFNYGVKTALGFNSEVCCYFVDVDEFVVSNSTTKITKIVENELVKRNTSRLYVHSFDTQDNFTKDTWYSLQDPSCFRWNYESRSKTVFKDRGKSIMLASKITLPIPQINNAPHDLGTPIKLYTEEDCRDFDTLRIHHLRIPTLVDGQTKIDFVKDETLKHKTIGLTLNELA